MTAGLLLGLALAQSATVQTTAGATDLRRIRAALEAAPPLLVATRSVERDGPIFRMKIQAFELEAAWKDRSMVPPYVRTWFRLSHHEFLEQVDHCPLRRRCFAAPPWLRRGFRSPRSSATS